MNDQVRKNWNRFDELIGAAESPDTKAILEAIKMQTEMINLNLTGLAHVMTTIARSLPVK
jgi:hypothetical protein